MKHIFRIVFLLTLLLVGQARAEAQGFAVSVTTSTNSVIVNTPLTYTINLTNLVGVLLQNTFVTNTFPSPVEIVSTNGFVTTSGDKTFVIYQINSFYVGGYVQIVLTVQPTAAGSFTNTINVVNDTTTNRISTNVVVEAVARTVDADLGVNISGLPSEAFLNDWITYSLSVTNSGPDGAPDVVLTNNLPAGVILLSPTNEPISTNGNILFNLGTLANGGFTNFNFTVQPTNTGTQIFLASVGTASVLNTNSANSFATNSLVVTNYLSTNLVAVTNSPQIYNMQNNLVEQGVLLTNEGSNSVPAARVIVLGLTRTNVLFNASGTNNGNPYVVYASRLDAGYSVKLLLQFAANSYFPFANSQLQAFGVTPPDLAAPPQTTTSTNINIVSITRLSSGGTLIWFRSVSNRTYTVAYTSNLSSTNWVMAQPSFVAPTTFTEWIDYGPPGTLSHPTNAPMRFYRVFQNP